MSDTSDSSKQENYKRATIGNIFTSTPIDNAPTKRRYYTSSLSRIGTSSSSGDRIEGKSDSQIAKKPVKKRKNVSKNKSKKDKEKVISLNDTKQVTSTEWATESEESIKEVLSASRESIPKENDVSINLFDDPCTPEKIRDAPITCESPLHESDSPILFSSRRFRSAIKRYNIASDKLLPVNIPSSEVWNSKETDLEDEIILNRTNNVKTYTDSTEKHAGFNAKKNSPNSLGIFWNATYPPECLSLSDLLWEEFVKKNREEMPQSIIASVSTQLSARKYNSEFLRKYPDIPPKFLDDSDPAGTICIQMHSDKDSRKWVTMTKLIYITLVLSIIYVSRSSQVKVTCGKKDSNDIKTDASEPQKETSKDYRKTLLNNTLKNISNTVKNINKTLKNIIKKQKDRMKNFEMDKIYINIIMDKSSIKYVSLRNRK
ncbi:uncharacterized protein [Anoplolepis gracilipes]|uniref:uncharacterized protein isoform X3 n=1 Tax=Anoplolepis gracilipes TaxID=354296 RepID=UPI003BA39D76